MPFAVIDGKNQMILVAEKEEDFFILDHPLFETRIEVDPLALLQNEINQHKSL